MSQLLETLETAISDVGYWRWWISDLPDRFHVEFGGVQLWFPARSPQEPPASVIALRFLRPLFIHFLQDPAYPHDSGFIPDWHHAIHEDRCEPFTISNGEFTLTSRKLFQQLLTTMDVASSPLPGEARLSVGPAFLAFRAGPVGLTVIAHSMQVHCAYGELTAEAVLSAHDKWWDYWREYWQRKRTSYPLPHDYACEVTIPTGT